MNIQDYFCIAASLITFIFSIFYLVKGRKVKIICNGSNKIVIYIVYIFLALCVFIKNANRIGVICSVIIVISGVIYSLVPSGYDENGIYLNGRLFRYNKISQMEFDYVNDYYQLSFTCSGKTHTLISNSNDKEKLKGALSLYNEQKGSRL